MPLLFFVIILALYSIGITDEVRKRDKVIDQQERTIKDCERHQELRIKRHEDKSD